MKFVAHFASSPSLAHFCRTEFLTVSGMLGVDDVVAVAAPGGGWLNTDRGDSDDPFFVFESQSSLAALTAVADRCILVRAIYILLQAAPTLEALYAWRAARDTTAAMLEGSTAAVIAGEDEAGLPAEGDYAYSVETLRRRYSAAEKAAVVAAVAATNPAVAGRQASHGAPPHRRFSLLVQHEEQKAPAGAAKGWEPAGACVRALHVVLLAASGRAAVLGRYDLKKRPYIGTTSMPPEESTLLANMALVRPGQLAYDPFCGTGSLLVAAAHCGAHTVGSDADGRAMRAGTRKGAASPQLRQQRQVALAAYTEAQLAVLTEEERELPTMRSNFKVYGLPPPDCARMNFSAWEAGWRTTTTSSASSSGTGEVVLFDAILTDPPYGIREPRKKVTGGTATCDAKEDSGSGGGGLAPYATDEVVLDLVLFAAAHLPVGGRLALWLPTTDGYTPDELPTHPSMRLVADLPQRLSCKVVRRLIAMEKVAPLPHPRPTRAACAPKKVADDLNSLIRATSVPENLKYTEYRVKRQRKTEAAQRYRAGLAAGSGGGEEAVAMVDKKRARGQGRSQEDMVANREKNMRRRQELQDASHAANLLRGKEGKGNPQQQHKEGNQ